MKYCFSFFLFCHFFSFSFAQKEGDNWVLSDPFIIRFNQDTIERVDTFVTYPRLPFFNTSFTASDSSGNLLFYTDGAYIYNRQGRIMDGCDTFISPSSYISSITNNGTGVGAGSAQGAIGFKKPGSDHLYYLFHNISSDCAYPDGWACYLYYSLIDMSLNLGLGKVVELNHVLYTDNISYLSPNALGACRHANGVDWWLVQGKSHKQEDNLVFLVDNNGIHDPLIQTIGDTTILTNLAGRIVFSPDGTIMAKATGVGRTNLFDFNRCDGTLSNPRYISTVDSIRYSDPLPASCNIAFSPSGRFLYVTNILDVRQYDLWASDIQESEVVVWDIDTLNSNYTLFITQLAPDGRIYIGPHSSGSERKNLTFINKPNEKGVACDFRFGGVPFPRMKWHGLGIPNMPDFRLSASPVYFAEAGIDRSICKDSLTQLGADTLLNELVYTWSSNDLTAFINDIHTPNPMVSTNLDEVEFYVTAIDTVSRNTCMERTDTVKVATHYCEPNSIHIPTFINGRINPYFIITNPSGMVSLRVFNAAGQLVYGNTNYQNEWNSSSYASGVYIIEATIGNTLKLKSKVVVFN